MALENFANFDDQKFDDVDEMLDENGQPLVRWAPLGANDTSEMSPSEFSDEKPDIKMQNIIEEHEALNASLLSLTSHFAQVQFRLEQVLHADPDQKELLLKELEQFAWKGVPDLTHMRLKSSNKINDKEQVNEPKDDPKKYVKVVIDQLKTQLDDLEQFAYKNGEIQQPPTLTVLEKQRIVLAELGDRLGFNAMDLDTISDSEIADQINSAILQLTSPIKTHEALVVQLKTQIGDLERFIDFLHDDETPDSSLVKALQAFKKHQEEQLNGVNQANSVPSGYHFGNSRRRRDTMEGNAVDADAKQKPANLITRLFSVLQLFKSSQLATKKTEVSPKAIKTATSDARTRHWGDVRARLEMAIEAVVEKSAQLNAARAQLRQNAQQENPPGAPLIASQSSSRLSPAAPAKKFNKMKLESQAENASKKMLGTSVTGSSDQFYITFANAERELNIAIRRQFCPALALLIEHGLRSVQSNAAYGAGTRGHQAKENGGILANWGFGCFSRRGSFAPHGREVVNHDDSESDEDEEEELEEEIERHRPEISGWTVFQKFYIMKNGRAFNDTPARKLSESFSLDIIGGKVITAKQQLLSSMGTILQLFNKYKQSEDSQFRALVCMALNNHKLVPWLKLVLRNPFIVQYLYYPWSYVASTGFDDALKALNKLSSLEFNLSFDASVRHLQAIQDVF